MNEFTPLRAFFIMGPKFLYWPLAMAREIATRAPGSRFCGLVSGPEQVFELAAADSDPILMQLEWLDDLERQWLDTPIQESAILHYEQLLGTDTLRRILIADRQVGRGFISGARTPRSRLIERLENAEFQRRYVINQINWAHRRLTEQGPDIVFANGVAGSATLTLAELCRTLKIPFLRLSPCRHGNLYIVDDSPLGLLAPVRRRFEAMLQSPSDWTHQLHEAQKHLEEFRTRPRAPQYAQFNRARRNAAISWSKLTHNAALDLARTIRDGVSGQRRELRWPYTWHRAWLDLDSALRARRLLRAGRFRSLAELPQRPFAYFPLQVDPEASTMVLAPKHTDQIAVVEAMAKSLPFGMDLVVKEHAPMLGKRPAGYYERICRIPGVTLVGPFEDGLALVAKAALTCVITGTAGWQAMLLRRPTVVLGNAPYLAVGQGFVSCPELNELSGAIHRALLLPPADDSRLGLYLAAIKMEGFELSSELFWGDVTQATVEAHREVLDALCDGLFRRFAEWRDAQQPTGAASALAGAGD